MRRERGFTLIELLVVMAIIALLLSLLLPALAKARQTARQIKDSTQIKQVHTSFLSYAASTEGGKFPTPGLIDRLPLNGTDYPGRGPEDVEQNTHANLYSAMIALNYFTPQLVYSPSEVSGKFAIFSAYNYELYNPTGDVYWDPGFRSDPAVVCHTSYAAMPILGARKASQWKNTVDSKFAIMGNRGPINGGKDPAAYKISRTLEIHGGRKTWEGNVCFNDNHMLFAETCLPEGIDYPDPANSAGTLPDNLFVEDVSPGNGNLSNDCYLSICRKVTGGATEIHELIFD
jgi:prepilin-type N-terminal cleavage/methylation domain-containing protein